MEHNYKQWSPMVDVHIRSLAGFVLLVWLRLLFLSRLAPCDLTVPSWLAPAAWVTCLSMSWESSWDAKTAGHDFLEWWPFFLHPACLDPRLLFLGEQPPHALSCKAVGGAADPYNDGGTGGSNPLHSLMCLFICWQDEVTALRQVPHAKFAL